MKLNAIANCGSKKDFIDLCELLERLDLSEAIGWFCEKYPASNAFTVIRSMAWFEDAEAELNPVSLNGIGWLEVKSRVSDAVSEL